MSSFSPKSPSPSMTIFSSSKRRSPIANGEDDTLSLPLRLRRLKVSDSIGFLVLFILSAFFFLIALSLRGYLDISFPWPFRQVDGVSRDWALGKGNCGGNCDWFDGDWVWDERYPLYESRDCEFLDLGFRCSENGRPDAEYAKWRWQPACCDLPRFNAKTMLEKLRNRRVAFIGDSIGRNHWESLLCMLSMEISNKSSIYEVNGNPITKHMGFLVFKFEEYNCTVEYYRSPFLVLQSRPPAGTQEEIKTTLKLDILDWTFSYWKDADILVFNTGHWWNYEKTIRSGCYFQEGNDIKMGMSVHDAYNRAIQTLFEWIHKEVDYFKTHVIFRTYAPVHFSGGTWKTNGSCHLETLPDIGISKKSQKTWAHFLEPVKHARNNSTASRVAVDLLNVTRMSDQRKDGHLSVFYLGDSGPAPLHRQDCSHWCLPGVPDAWNELLYALFMKRESLKVQNSSSFRITGVKLST